MNMYPMARKRMLGFVHVPPSAEYRDTTSRLTKYLLFLGRANGQAA
jgi:hypothetical protein